MITRVFVSSSWMESISLGNFNQILSPRDFRLCGEWKSGPQFLDTYVMDSSVRRITWIVHAHEWHIVVGCLVTEVDGRQSCFIEFCTYLPSLAERSFLEEFYFGILYESRSNYALSKRRWEVLLIQSGFTFIERVLGHYCIRDQLEGRFRSISQYLNKYAV